MSKPTFPLQRTNKPTRASRISSKNLLGASAFAAAALWGLPAHAVDFGPNDMFSLIGFAQVELGRVNNQCPGGACRLTATENNRYLPWADAIVPGLKLSSSGTTFTQLNLRLSAKHDLSQGFKLKGTLAQNLINGSVETPGFWREKSVELSHEEYGTLAVGDLTSRTWMFADTPLSGDLGLVPAWANTGAGYRNITNAIRYTSKVLDVAGGDMVLEATYAVGNTSFKINKPRFLELWAHYGKGDLSLDAMYQDSRNGVPSAFGASVFNGLHPNAALADGKLGSSGQSVAVLQAVYQFSKTVELKAGVRRNRWSGAYTALIVAQPGNDQWADPFNIDWFGFANGVVRPAYPARSTDILLGARYRMDKWTFHTGAVYYSKASTANPVERGQSNSALVNTIGASYAYGKGWEFSAGAGMVHFARKGLAPLSLPAHGHTSGIDSRVTKAGNWFTVGAKYTF
jgi:predicted porin